MWGNYGYCGGSIVLSGGSIVFEFLKSTYKKANLDLFRWWFGNFVGKTWEKLFFSWEKLGTFDSGVQQVTEIFGNFVGITFFFVGITWE